MTETSGETEGTTPPQSEPNFSAARALEAIGERWALLVIRDAVFDGTTLFSEFLRRLAIAPDVLDARLDALVGAGLMYEHSNATHEYRITQRGRNLAPVILALTSWEDGWEFPLDTRGVAAIRPATKDTPANTEATDEKAGSPDVEPEPEPEPTRIEIFLLGTFVLKVGGTEIGPLPLGTQRLLAFLALHDRAMTRSAMAGTMWPDTSEERAGISLRSALSRLDRTTHEAILSASAGLSLADSVDVDFRDAQALAHRLLTTSTPQREPDLGDTATATLSSELLPDWYDDWVLPEAADWRQLRVGALEAQSEALITAGRLADSANAARAAMKVDPLRESATACLVRAHLAKGNQSEALRAVDIYSELLWNSLGLKPTEKLTGLVAAISV
ncbi:MAG TPA: BTAD domain-containing putative transcriptional regulator [Galbitalea sp.]|jgi:DNA-binding SARP family transcriptional activator/DNA-binding HxlR family transcriptional regulator